ncbi:Tabersonine 16-O-methyltransferase [Cucumis melo var. makuwa]|uniref:Tabersonine 16-O-methyltransferase n=1 Tax=Cucumis melo var. makuwa TaxID=1194695 RepID=A0A5A7UCC2_CUCMM|nr:Tabersonine 16-O-methyltransferase [Cucumis melo var. makuwa]
MHKLKAERKKRKEEREKERSKPRGRNRSAAVPRRRFTIVPRCRSAVIPRCHSIAVCHFSGRERNEKEWNTLFLAVGFGHYTIIPILGLRSLIVVYPN